MLKVDVQVEVQQVAGLLGQYEKQVPFATAVALTRTAQEGQAEMRRAFVAKFDRPTPYTLKNALFIKPATKAKLEAQFGVKDAGALQKSGGLSPADILGHHFTGGVSRSARYEQAFRRIGMLGINEDIVPADRLPELNQYGGVPPGLIVRLLSYFSAFGEQGFKANATAQTRAKLAKRTDKNTKGKRASKYVRINGVVYFYSSGAGRTAHLARGIWAKTGVHGVDIRPILMFVDRANYRKRFDINDFAQSAQRNFAQHFDTALTNAMRTAR